MKINQEKRNGRTLLDKGDIKSALLLLSNLKEIDTPTLMVVIKLLDHTEEVFEALQPKEGSILPIELNDYVLFKELDKVYRKNFKTRKRKRKKGSPEEVRGLVTLEPPAPVDPNFTPTQLEQIKVLIQAQNKDIESMLLTALQTIISSAKSSPESKIKAEKKPKPTAK